MLELLDTLCQSKNERYVVDMGSLKFKRIEVEIYEGKWNLQLLYQYRNKKGSRLLIIHNNMNAHLWKLQ